MCLHLTYVRKKRFSNKCRKQRKSLFFFGCCRRCFYPTSNVIYTTWYRTKSFPSPVCRKRFSFFLFSRSKLQFSSMQRKFVFRNAQERKIFSCFLRLLLTFLSPEGDTKRFFLPSWQHIRGRWVSKKRTETDVSFRWLGRRSRKKPRQLNQEDVEKRSLTSIFICRVHLRIWRHQISETNFRFFTTNETVFCCCPFYFF